MLSQADGDQRTDKLGVPLCDRVPKRQTPDKNGPVPGCASRLIARRMPLRMEAIAANRSVTVALIVFTVPPKR